MTTAHILPPKKIFIILGFGVPKFSQSAHTIFHPHPKKQRFPLPRFEAHMVHGVGHAHGQIYDCGAGFSNWMQGWSDSKKVPKVPKATNWEFPTGEVFETF